MNWNIFQPNFSNGHLITPQKYIIFNLRRNPFKRFFFEVSKPPLYLDIFLNQIILSLIKLSVISFPHFLQSSSYHHISSSNPLIFIIIFYCRNFGSLILRDTFLRLGKGTDFFSYHSSNQFDLWS